LWIQVNHNTHSRRDCSRVQVPVCLPACLHVCLCVCVCVCVCGPSEQAFAKRVPRQSLALLPACLDAPTSASSSSTATITTTTTTTTATTATTADATTDATTHATDASSSDTTGTDGAAAHARSLEDHEVFAQQRIAAWLRRHAPNVHVLGGGGRSSASASSAGSGGRSLPIFSFLVRRGRYYLHFNFVSALLNDLFGIQARGGCACAGPYAQHLLGMTADHVDAM
jgi:hypothetical protein